MEIADESTRHQIQTARLLGLSSQRKNQQQNSHTTIKIQQQNLGMRIDGIANSNGKDEEQSARRGEETEDGGGRKASRRLGVCI